MKIDEILKNVPTALVAWAFVVGMVIVTAFSSLALYAWFEQKTLVLAGYEFGIPSIGQGAIVAYDLTDCPEGWSRFKEGTGRMIVGAGEDFVEGFRKDESEANLEVRSYRNKGGEMRHKLKFEEMIDHRHKQDFDTAPLPVSGGRNVDFVVRGEGNVEQAPTPVDTVPHNNMPPYIALYFCKKN